MRNKTNIVISSGSYPSEGMLTLIKYLSYSILETKNFNKKYNLKILIFNENLTLRLKKIIYNFYLQIKNIFNSNYRIHKFGISAENFKKENKKLAKYVSTYQGEEDYKKLILEEYTFLKRPVVVYDNFISIGSSTKAVESLKSQFDS